MSKTTDFSSQFLFILGIMVQQPQNAILASIVVVSEGLPSGSY